MSVYVLTWSTLSSVAPQGLVMFDNIKMDGHSLEHVFGLRHQLSVHHRCPNTVKQLKYTYQKGLLLYHSMLQCSEEGWGQGEQQTNNSFFLFFIIIIIFFWGGEKLAPSGMHAKLSSRSSIFGKNKHTPPWLCSCLKHIHRLTKLKLAYHRACVISELLGRDSVSSYGCCTCSSICTHLKQNTPRKDI